ncbi:MAG: TRAP transporter substrate-binding protein [Synergistaceae bacterium]|nr:TRAP transporter substrate-binding protein [Synergistaceae bacterium]
MKKHVNFAVAALVIILLVFACVPAFAASEKPLTLRIAHVVTEKGGEHLGSLKLKEILEKKSGGKIIVEIYPNGSMGQNREMIESMQAGALDMGLPALPALGGFTDATKVFDLLYLFNDRKEAEKVLDGEVGKTVAKSVEKSGVKIISWWSQGFRESTSNRKFVKPEDLKGLKIRVMDNPLHIEAWNTLGASAIPMAFSEVLTSLQQGVLDAQENPYQNIVQSGFDKVQKYIIETGHLYGPLPLVFSKKVWDKLTPEQQKMIQEAADETKIYEREAQEKINKDLRDGIVKSKTCTIVTLTPEQKNAFRAKLLPLYKKHASSTNGLLEKIYHQLGRKIDFK